MTEFQSYSRKRTAIRGFDRQFPTIDPTPYIQQVDDKWGFYPDQVDTTGEVEAMAVVAGDQDTPTDLAAPENQVGAPSEDESALAIPHKEIPLPAPPVVNDTVAVTPAEESAEAPASGAPAEGASEGAPAAKVRQKSEMKGAVKACWDFYTANPTLRRKDAVTTMVERGVAFYTARTQYQRWFSARKAARGEPRWGEEAP